MPRSHWLAVFAPLVFALPAHAEDPPAPPKPAPALVEAFKGMEGTWACTGSMDNPAKPGTQVSTKGEMKISREVDGFVYSGAFKMDKNAVMPMEGKARLHWAYDSSKKQLVEFGYDNAGSVWSSTSDGLKDGAVVWTGEGTMMGQSMKSRTTVNIKSPHEITVVSEMDNKGAWQKMGEDHCKKK
jgi:hypothetical protein